MRHRPEPFLYVFLYWIYFQCNMNENGGIHVAFSQHACAYCHCHHPVLGAQKNNNGGQQQWWLYSVDGWEIGDLLHSWVIGSS